jgi:hypothetical protein
MEASLELDNLEAGVADRPFGVARRTATAERARPEETVQCTLETSKGRICGGNVLPETQLAARYQHATQLAQCSRRIRDAAQDSHDDGRVEGLVLRRERLSGSAHDIDPDACMPGALHGSRTCRRIGLDREHARHLRRVMLEGLPIPTADLDHAAAQASENATTEIAGDEVGTARLSPLEVPRKTRLLRPVERRTRLSCRYGRSAPSGSRQDRARSRCANRPRAPDTARARPRSPAA